VGLLAVVVYLYTVVAFNFFRKFYNKSEDGEPVDMKCDDMLTVSEHLYHLSLSIYLLGLEIVMGLMSKSRKFGVGKKYLSLLYSPRLHLFDK